MGRFKSKFTELSAFDVSTGSDLVGGVDEVGRGALAGPIVGACVIYDMGSIMEMEEQLFYVRDSKSLSKSKMREISDSIKASAVHYDVFYYDNSEIDLYGIQQCNRGLIDSALDLCDAHSAGLLLIDGTISPSGEAVSRNTVPWRKLPKADSKSLAVASASIIAKDFRDSLMRDLPVSEEYGFSSNVGYGAAQHLEAIERLGITEYHRRSFLKRYIGEQDATP